MLDNQSAITLVQDAKPPFIPAGAHAITHRLTDTSGVMATAKEVTKRVS